MEQRVSTTPPAALDADVLILAAHAPDLVGFRAALGEALCGSVRHLRAVGKTIGVGLAVAGAGTARRIAQLRPRSAILVGTAGIYPHSDRLRALDVLVPSRVHVVDAAVALGKAAFSDPMQTALETHPLITAGLLAGGSRSRQASIATCLAQTTDDALAHGIGSQTGCDAETLEAFAFVAACNAAEIPCAVVLGATHVVGAHGKAEWRQHHRQAVMAAAEVVETWMHNGAQGLPHR